MTFLTLLFLLIVGCSKNTITDGGGADIGSPMIIEITLSATGEPVANTPFYILPSDYIATDSLPPYSFTDQSGSSLISIYKDTTYTLYASFESGKGKFGILKTDIIASETPIQCNLSKLVALSIILPNEYYTDDISLVIPGVPNKLKHKIVTMDNQKVIVIDELPIGIIPPIYLIDNTGRRDKITDSIVLHSEGQVTTAFTSWINITTDNSPLVNDSIYSVYQDRKGKFWYGSFNGGLYNGDSWRQYSLGAGETVLSIVEDLNYTLWCATSSGLFKMINNELIKIDLLPTADMVYDVEFDDENNMWIGTDSGLYFYDNVSWKHYTIDNSELSNNQIYSLTWHDGSLYIGTFGGGIYVIQDKLWIKLSEALSGLVSNYVYDTKISADGTLWCATAKGISMMLNNQWKTLDSSNSQIPHNVIKALTIDKTDVVWAGTSYGLVRYDKRDMKVFTSENSQLSSSHCLDIYANEEDNTITIGTMKGVTILKPIKNW